MQPQYDLVADAATAPGVADSKGCRPSGSFRPGVATTGRTSRLLNVPSTSRLLLTQPTATKGMPTARATALAPQSTSRDGM